MQVEPPKSHDAFSYDIAGEFDAAMAEMAVPANARVAVAVSGGADSLALAWLMARWAAPRGVTVYALTVDHDLRDAAADEARQVAAWLAPLRLAHTTLRWDEGRGYRTRPASAQGPAREARYALLLDWCAANNCTHLFTAHHADDQAETFLLRLARGSGVDGLGAMAPLSERAGVAIARPLLRIGKQRLVAFCNEMGQPWIEDPSNSDAAYGRVRMRGAREMLEREGLSTDRLLATAGHMRRARAALDHYVQALLQETAAWDRFGLGRITLGPFLAAPDEIGLRALAAILKSTSGQVYPPRFERLSRLYESLRAGPWRDATLHGCRLVRDGVSLIVAREPAQVEGEHALPPDRKILWDGRFEASVTGTAQAFRVARLTAAAGQQAMAESWAEVPLLARETLPAVFDSAGLAAIPLLNYVRTDLTTSPSVTFQTAFICPRNDQFTEDDAEL